MDDRIREMAEDLRFSAERKGFDLEELISALQEQAVEGPGQQARGGSLDGPTIREFVPTVIRSLSGTKTETARTYKTSLKLLANGIALEDVVYARGGGETRAKPWTDERVERWLHHAHRLAREWNFALELPRDPESCTRNEHASAVIWAGLGHLPVRSATQSLLVEGAQWARLRALAGHAERHERLGTSASRKETGDGAVRTYVCAMRSAFKLAAGDGLLPSGANPAGRLSLEGTAPATRRPITDEHGDEALVIFSETGDDPELDAWLYHYHCGTAARQEGGWRLRRFHLDLEKQLIYPPDKNSSAKNGHLEEDDAVPVKRDLIEGLLAFAESRGSTEPEDPVFVTKRTDPATGRPTPLTRRRYNTIYKRMRQHTDWAEERAFGVHHLRGWVAGQLEDRHGRRYKMRLLRHRPNGQTDRYGMASLPELAWALSQDWGEPHPLAAAPKPGRRRTAQ